MFLSNCDNGTGPSPVTLAVKATEACGNERNTVTTRANYFYTKSMNITVWILIVHVTLEGSTWAYTGHRTTVMESVCPVRGSVVPLQTCELIPKIKLGQILRLKSGTLSYEMKLPELDINLKCGLNHYKFRIQTPHGRLSVSTLTLLCDGRNLSCLVHVCYDYDA